MSSRPCASADQLAIAVCDCAWLPWPSLEPDAPEIALVGKMIEPLATKFATHYPQSSISIFSMDDTPGLVQLSGDKKFDALSAHLLFRGNQQDETQLAILTACVRDGGLVQVLALGDKSFSGHVHQDSYQLLVSMQLLSARMVNAQLSEPVVVSHAVTLQYQSAASLNGDMARFGISAHTPSGASKDNKKTTTITTQLELLVATGWRAPNQSNAKTVMWKR